jgi:hypothetical protein
MTAWLGKHTGGWSKEFTHDQSSYANLKTALRHYTADRYPPFLISIISARRRRRRRRRRRSSFLSLREFASLQEKWADLLRFS